MVTPRRSFHSDNEADVAPEIIVALSRTNEGMARSYGADAITKRLHARSARSSRRSSRSARSSPDAALRGLAAAR
jgi:threonine aldolase